MEDKRHIITGNEIPTKSYSDQPYIVKTDDDHWLCVVTTGLGEEGSSGQHVTSLRSPDKGKTWSKPVPLEDPEGPESSYAVLMKVPSGRIYCFYNHNTDDIRWIKGDKPAYPDGKCTRVDSLGYFVFKYSDDHGKTWSEKRYNVPVREFEIDLNNPYGGKIRYFWNVGKAFTYDGIGYVPLHKVGGIGAGFFTSNEGVLLKSDNIMTEEDPEKINWETLPDGDVGLRTPPGGGPVAGEQSFSVLSDGTFYCVYRSIDGYPVYTYSRDRGHTWEEPKYKKYADGRKMKHPRAANFAWRCNNGKFLYWCHNHGGHFIPDMMEYEWGYAPYEDRNPVWLCGGLEVDGPNGKELKWTQPEIVLYDDDPFIRMSYPDLVEEDGQYFLTETQKDKARVHEVDPDFLEKLWNQFEIKEVAKKGIILDLPENGKEMPFKTEMPKLPVFNVRDIHRADYGTKNLRQAFSVDMWIKFDKLNPGDILLDTRKETGQGLCLKVSPRKTVEIILNDGRMENRWDCDPDVLTTEKLHHIAVIVDAGPRVISFIVDGKLCDGAEFRQFGWGRFSIDLREANGSDTLRIAPSFNGKIEKLRFYDRFLTTTEAIGNFRAGK